MCAWSEYKKHSAEISVPSKDQLDLLTLIADKHITTRFSNNKEPSCILSGTKTTFSKVKKIEIRPISEIVLDEVPAMIIKN